MTDRDIAALILAAGKGTRMTSSVHKVLHPVGGRPMLLHLLDSVAELGASRRIVILGAERDQVARAVPDLEIVVQEPQAGTGHAVMQAREQLAGFSGDVLVLYGDVPLVSPETMRMMVRARREADAALCVLGFHPADPARYGRLVTGADGALERIVEYKDAGPDERAIGFCNSGMMAIDGLLLFDLLDAVGNDNASGEYYLTDLVAIARDRGLAVTTATAGEADVAGVNSRAELAAVEAIFQQKARAAAMAGGATLLDPDSVYFAFDTEIGRDVTIGPNVVFGPGVRIGDNVRIEAFCHLEGAEIAEGATIGPFARLRPGAVVGRQARVGNFVEVKKAVLETGAKANHLAYIGDARIGERANIGAGTITCNYDGFAKHHTDIGAGAFIGSNSALVAPVRIGKGAIVGAGSAISKDVRDDALALTRPEQKEVADWARKFRERKDSQRKK